MTQVIKKAGIAIMVAIFIATICLSMVILPSKVYANPYAIGDTGPAGGIIFYINGSYCLEAAPSDLVVEVDTVLVYTFIWSHVITSYVPTQSGIGTGQSNTNAIIAQDWPLYNAARYCADYVSPSGYSDWFLPSMDELNEMYKKRLIIGGFNNEARYWSSSEYIESNARDQWFLNGGQNWSMKTDDQHVRPIRAFTASAAAAEPVWIRDTAMKCKVVWINEDGDFQFSFIHPYADNNWVKIYDMSGKEVFSIDMPYDNPNIIVDLPDGTYTVKTFHDQPEPLQTFIIGKP
jgi:hypothetical protein